MAREINDYKKKPDSSLKFLERQEQQRIKIENWANLRPETRVDINEAADAVEFHQTFKVEDEPLQKLYECLFVSRIFKQRFLSRIQFERCIFVNCTFEVEDVSKIRISESQIIRSRFRGAQAEITIRSCRMFGTFFLDFDDSRLVLWSCEIYATSMHGTPSSLRINGSNIYNSNFYGQYEDGATTTKIDFQSSNFVETSVSTLKATADSDFSILGALGSRFSSMDLSEISEANFASFLMFDADGRTQHPINLARPSNWPDYDPDDLDDDIPF